VVHASEHVLQAARVDPEPTFDGLAAHISR
jgi:hypothetical protein